MSHRIKTNAKREKIDEIRSLLRDTNVQSIIPEPLKGKVSVYFDVFSTEYEEYFGRYGKIIPDIDRLVHHILDAIQGQIYDNDRQIDDLKVRIWDTSDIQHILEVKSHPDGLYEMNNVPLGLLYPVSMDIKDYYVMRVCY